MILSLAAVASLALAGSATSARGEDPPALQAQPVRIPGTRVSMVVPDGHEPGRGFHGYQWPEQMASVMVIELPGPYAQAIAGFEDAEQLARSGMKLLDAADTKVCGRDGKLLHLSLTAQGATFHKWLAMCGAGRRTLMLHATYPEQRAAELSAPLKAALLGATWDPTLELDPLESLEWTIAPPEGLRFTGTVSKMLMYTENGEVGTKGGAWLGVGTSIGVVKDADPRATTEQRARQMPYEGLEILSSTAFEHPLRRGWEVVAKARDDKESAEVLVHVVMLFGEGEYALLSAQCPPDRRDTWLPRFRACARSWKPRTPPPGTPK